MLTLEYVPGLSAGIRLPSFLAAADASPLGCTNGCSGFCGGTCTGGYQAGSQEPGAVEPFDDAVVPEPVSPKVEAPTVDDSAYQSALLTILDPACVVCRLAPRATCKIVCATCDARKVT